MYNSIIIKKIKKIIHVFHNKGALSEGKALTLNELGMQPGFLVDKMVQNKIIVKTNSGKFYLNEAEELDYLEKLKTGILKNFT